VQGDRENQRRERSTTMTENILKKLVPETVSLDREIN
jgi:hypothetical protein